MSRKLSTANNPPPKQALAAPEQDLTISDRELLAVALSSKDPIVAEALFSRAIPYIQRVALGHLTFRFPSIQGFDQDAVIQDVIVSIWDTRAGFKSERGTTAWVAIVTRSRAVDYLRGLNSRRSQSTLSLDSMDREVATQILSSGTEQDPAILVEREDAARATQCRIDLLIAKLPQPDREMLQMQMADTRYQDIASSLGIPLGTLKSRLFQVRQHLKRQLSSDSE